MAKSRTSWGDVMNALIKQHGSEKDQSFFITWADEAESILEEEINAMTNVELIMLMEAAGIIQAPLSGTEG